MIPPIPGPLVLFSLIQILCCSFPKIPSKLDPYSSPQIQYRVPDLISNSFLYPICLDLISPNLISQTLSPTSKFSFLCILFLSLQPSLQFYFSCPMNLLSFPTVSTTTTSLLLSHPHHISFCSLIIPSSSDP